jgi:hypothetical protein
MKFNYHPNLEGSHAFLSPSKYSWVNYDDQKLEAVYINWRASQQGTELHELAAKLIRLGVKLPKVNKTLNMYVNDGIGFRMSTEVCLFYSINAFGTADAITFKNKLLRIHDLKNGRTPASIKQLEVYAALFCLEYAFNPRDIEIELRLYQLDEVLVENPLAEDIFFIMERIVVFDKRINDLKE